MTKFLYLIILVVLSSFSENNALTEIEKENEIKEKPEYKKDWYLLDKPVHRAMWVWNYDNADVMFDFCQNKSINELYVCIGEYYWNSNYNIPNQDELAEFIKKANSKGIKVWGLYYLWKEPKEEYGLNYLGDVEAGEHIATAQKIMDGAARFNRKYPDAGLHGMQCDNETKKSELLIPFIDFCKAATERAEFWNDTLKAEGKRPLLHSAALRPSWIKSEKVNYNGNSEYVAYHYLTVCNHAAVMNYTSNGNNFKNTAARILKWADAIPGSQEVVIGVEVNDIVGRWHSAKDETYADEIMAENNVTRFNKFEEDMDNAEEEFIKYPSYSRITVHSFEGYINHWFPNTENKNIERAPEGTKFVDLNKDNSHWAKPLN